MGFALAPTALTEGFRLEAFDTVGSTNVLALERAREGDPGRLWLAARRQETGRGRRGRVWETPSGNLAATLLLVDCCPMSLAATLGFVAGLALSDALTAVAPETRVADFLPRTGCANPDLDACLNMDEAEFDKHFAGSPIRRAKYEAFRRNLLIAKANLER